MIKELPVSFARIYWNGCVRPPFLERINELILAKGFQFKEHDLTAPCSVWRRPFFRLHEIELCIWPEKASGAENFSVTASINIVSARHAEVSRLLSLQECEGWLDMANSESPSTVCLFSVSLNWLLAAWQPSIGTFGQSFRRWKEIHKLRSVEVAQDFVLHFLERCDSLNAMVGSPVALANALADIENFPGAADGVGPRSASPNEYAFVLYADAGLVAEAKKQLLLLEARDSANVVAPDTEWSCISSRLREWAFGSH